MITPTVRFSNHRACAIRWQSAEMWLTPAASSPPCRPSFPAVSGRRSPPHPRCPRHYRPSLLASWAGTPWCLEDTYGQPAALQGATLPRLAESRGLSLKPIEIYRTVSEHEFSEAAYLFHLLSPFSYLRPTPESTRGHCESVASHI